MARTHRNGQRRNNRPQRPRAIRPFVHPYNFIPLPEQGLGEAAEETPFARAPFPTHARYLSGRHSGTLTCSLTLETHAFIPHPRKCVASEENNKEHKELGYFTLDPVGEWDPNTDDTVPALPAGSLRGMVRSTFETLTLSCFSVFDGGRLDYRLGRDPSSRGGARYLPARVVELKREDGSFECKVELLEGRSAADRARKVLPVALLYAYNERVRFKDRDWRWTTGRQTKLFRGITARNGEPVAVALGAMTRARKGYQYRPVEDLEPAGDHAKLHTAGCRPRDIRFGYLVVTGPNIENKHHERVFFDADATCNTDFQMSPEDRYQAFLSARPTTTKVGARIVEEADQMLAGYADRHEKDLKRAQRAPRRISNGKPPHLSDFVGAKKLREDDLVYALIDGNGTIQGIYPVAIPRMTHPQGRGDLLHEDFHKCREPEELCAACRVFGWVRGDEVGRKHERDQDRDDAVRGHVRFSHGLLQGAWGDRPERQSIRCELPILGSPKPTTTGFYLRERKGVANARKRRWPQACNAPGAFPPGHPMYRAEESRQRGRKHYPRREKIDPGSNDPTRDGLRRPEGEPDSQSRTVHLLPPRLQFRFHVHFDNLSGQELGALLQSLELAENDAAGWRAPAEGGFRHALGAGKPLGMGACRVQVREMRIHHRAENPSARYKVAPWGEGDVEPPEKPTISDLRKELFDAWSAAERKSPDLGATRAAFCELYAATPPNAPIHYPPNPMGRFDKNFEWFVQNKRGRRERVDGDWVTHGGLSRSLATPTEEREEEAKRLPVDPVEERAATRRGR